MYNSHERGAALVALRALEADPKFTHDAKTLGRNFSEATRKAIKAMIEENRAFNKSVKEAGKTQLTPEAATYWAEVQEAIKRGRAAQAAGDRAAEKQVSLLSEALAASFDARVPKTDQPKFQMLDLERHAETWDERWEYIEFPAPLLRQEFAQSYTIPNVVNSAQREIFNLIAQPPVDEERVESNRAMMLAMRRYIRDEADAQTLRETKAVWNKHASDASKKAANDGAKRVKAGMSEGLAKKPRLKKIPLSDISDEQPARESDA